MVKSIGPDGAEWLCRWIQLSICSLQELLRRIGLERDGLNLRKKLRKQRGSKTSQQKKPRGKGSQLPFKTDSVLAALFQLRKIDSPLLKEDIVSPLEGALNIKMEERLDIIKKEERSGKKRDYGLLAELNNDIELVCRGIKGIDRADYERVRDIFHQTLIKDCDKKFANLSEVEIIDSIVKDDKEDEDWRYLPHRVWEDAMDELVLKSGERWTRKALNHLGKLLTRAGIKSRRHGLKLRNLVSVGVSR
ncbi:MAG: hypothetical protein ACM3SR_01355 [Ignavibacteriales bacterium]